MKLSQICSMKKKIKKQDIFNNKFLKEFVESFQNNNEYVERGFFKRNILTNPYGH